MLLFLLKCLQEVENLDVGEYINCWLTFTSKIYPLQNSDFDQLHSKSSEITCSLQIGQKTALLPVHDLYRWIVGLPVVIFVETSAETAY